MTAADAAANAGANAGAGEEAQDMTFGTVEQALADIAAGKFVIVADDEDRENEGDLVCGAEKVTPEMVNFMLDAKGMICLAMENALADHLGLEMQVDENTEAMHTAFTVSIDAAAKYGVSTGISASDRATTIRVAVDPNSTRLQVLLTLLLAVVLMLLVLAQLGLRPRQVQRDLRLRQVLQAQG